jgi:DNA gyrase/topoisomerase IV subunit A
MTRLSVQFAYELDATESRLEVVRGYLKAIQKIDPVIKIIKAAATPKEALIELVSNRSLKFTSDQARAILEMRLRTLTNLDSKELAEEEERLIARTMELGSLIVNEKERNSYMAAEIKSIGVKYGETRRSEVIDPPDSLTLEKGPSGVASPVSKPRFLKVDSKRGIIEQAKGPRGALIVEKTDKIITLTQNGILRKLPATFKGPISGEYSSVILVKKEIEIKERKYLAVFTLDNQLKAMTIIGEDLCKVTSKGKHVIPPEANLIYFGEGLYQVPWSSNRKKKVELSPNTMKQGKPGARGIKVASVTDLAL